MSKDWRDKLRRGEGINLYQASKDDAPSPVVRGSVEDLTKSSTGSMGTLESQAFIDSKIELKKRFLPSLDFSDPSNFVKFGSAQKYYEDSISRVYNTYPFDGSHAEKVLWELSSSYLDTHIYTFEYPKTTGYVSFKPTGWGTQKASSGVYGLPQESEYIYFSGGPHADPDSNFKTGNPNIYSASDRRVSNLAVDVGSGNTVEFWLKKESFVDSSNTAREVLFDCTTPGHSEDVDSHFRFLIELDTTSSGQSWLVTFFSGSKGSHTGISKESIGTSASILGGTWNHHSFSVSHKDQKLYLKYYNNGQVNDEKTYNLGKEFSNVNVGLAASIGALAAKRDGAGALSYGQFSGSMDEFRFWKSTRTPREIGANMLSSVHGGTNRSLSNIDLGVYYKFNEGITGKKEIDSTILDYSGRISHGDFHGYNEKTRNINSAIDEYLGSQEEEKDPILYEAHPDVAILLDKKKRIGEQYDYLNSSAIINSLPSWILEEQENTSEKTKTLLSDLTQIMASYFDTAYFQIKELSQLKNVKYDDFYGTSSVSGSKPYPFMDRVLSSFSFDTINIFADLTSEEKLLNRTSQTRFKKDITNIKNFIYRNIYNNLTHIYKTKGTEASFRNLIRCFGIDDELIKITAYADNYKYKLENKYTYTNLKAKGINFNNPSAHAATIHQSTSGFEGASNYISGLAGSGHSATYEVNFTLPATLAPRGIPEHSFCPVSSSIFGLRTPQYLNTSDLASNSSGAADLHLYTVKTVDSPDQKDYYFCLESSVVGIPRLTSSIFQGGYKDEAWNVCAIIRPVGQKFASRVTNASSTYELVLRGWSYSSDTLEESFEVSSSVSNTVAEAFMAANKRCYVGSRWDNFTGSLVQASDINMESFRVYASELTSEDQQHHARDFRIFGHSSPLSDVNLMVNESSGVDVPKYATLVLHWGFNTVTGSDDGGTFGVYDMTSKTPGYGYLESLVGSEHPASGHAFEKLSNKFVSGHHRPLAKVELPEKNHSSDMVRINATDEEGHEIFEKGQRPITRFYSFEKSMYRSISEEMLAYVSSVNALNNLIGDPINKYRPDYKDLSKLRQHFFQFVESDLDLEKYTHYYRWIDTSISSMIDQLKPATTSFSEDVRNMIESHIFERNKYQHKYPTLELDTEIPITPILGINEMLYDWEHGHAPFDTSSWIAATGTISTTGNPGNDEEFSLTDADGLAVTYIFKTGVATVDGTKADGKVIIGVQGATGHAASTGDRIRAAIIASELNVAVVETSAGSMKLTQNTLGESGNTRIDMSGVATTTATNFTGGTGPNQEINCLWWKDRAERNESSSNNIASAISSGISVVDKNREKLRTVINSNVSGSNYPFRKLTLPYKVTSGKDLVLHSGHNFTRANKLSKVLDSNLHSGSLAEVVLSQSALHTFKGCDDVVDDPNKKTKIVGKAYTNHLDDYINADSDLLLPFSIYSASAPGGYTESTGLYARGIEIGNLHHDSYLENTEVPLQSPYTFEHFGGYTHRHVSPGHLTASSHDPSSGNNAGPSYERPEKFKINFTNSSEWVLKVQAEGDKDLFSANTTPNVYQRSIFGRESLVKRHYGIKNIKNNTAPDLPLSTALGNYQYDYDVVMVAGNQNRDLVDFDAANSVESTGTNEYFPGIVDIAQVQRQRSEHNIVSRFSRLGGGPVRLNYHYDSYASGEYSLYNSISLANLKPRTSLDQLYREHSSQYGLRSGSMPKIDGSDPYEITSSIPCASGGGSDCPDDSLKPSVAASIHKTNRNTSYRPDINLASYSAGTWTSAKRPTSHRDNNFVQRHIPQSDLQYRWIQDSSLETTGSFFGHESPLSIPAGSDGSIHNSLTFATSSEFGMAIGEVYSDKFYLNLNNTDSAKIKWYTLGANKSAVLNKDYNYDTGNNSIKSSFSNFTDFSGFDFLPIDRAGMSQIIYQEIDSDNNLLRPKFNSLRNWSETIKSIKTSTVGGLEYTASINFYEATPYTVVDSTHLGHTFAGLSNVIYQSSWSTSDANKIPEHFVANLTHAHDTSTSHSILISNSGASNTILAIKGNYLPWTAAAGTTFSNDTDKVDSLQIERWLPHLPAVASAHAHRIIESTKPITKKCRLTFSVYAGTSAATDEYGLDSPELADVMWLEVRDPSSKKWVRYSRIKNREMMEEGAYFLNELVAGDNNRKYSGKFTKVSYDIDIGQSLESPTYVRWVAEHSIASQWAKILPDGAGGFYGSAAAMAAALPDEFSEMWGENIETLENLSNVVVYDHWAIDDVKMEHLPFETEGYYTEIGSHVNSYISNKLGSYGWNSWNQLRASDNKLVEYFDKNNLLSFETDNNTRSELASFKEPVVYKTNNAAEVSYIYPDPETLLTLQNLSARYPIALEYATNWTQDSNAFRLNLSPFTMEGLDSEAISDNGTFTIPSYTEKFDRELPIFAGFGQPLSTVSGGVAQLFWESDYTPAIDRLKVEVYSAYLAAGLTPEQASVHDSQRATLYGTIPHHISQSISLFAPMYENKELVSYLNLPRSSRYLPDFAGKQEKEIANVKEFLQSTVLEAENEYFQIKLGVLPSLENAGFSKIRKREAFISDYWTTKREDRAATQTPVIYTSLNRSGAEDNFFYSSAFIYKEHEVNTGYRDLNSRNSMGIYSIDVSYNYRTAQNIASPFVPWGAQSYARDKEFLKLNQSVWPLDGRRNLKKDQHVSTDISSMALYPISPNAADSYVWSFKSVPDALHTSYLVEKASFDRNPGEAGQEYTYRYKTDPNGTPLEDDPYVVSFLGTPFISYTSLFPEPFVQSNASAEKMYYFKYTDTFADQASSKLAGSSARFVLQNPESAIGTAQYINDLTPWTIKSSSLDTRGQRGEGELQNDYSIYHMGASDLHVTPPPSMLYSRRVPQTIWTPQHGPIKSLGLLNGATAAHSGAWQSGQTGTVGVTSTTGHGSGAIIKYTTDGSGVPTFSLTDLSNFGSNYKPGDQIVLTDPGSTSSTANLEVEAISQYLNSTGDITGLRGFQVLSGDAPWEADIQSGLEPFYKNYEEYRENFRTLGQNSTILSEFKISDYVHDLYSGKYDNVSELVDHLKAEGFASLSLTGSTEGEDIEALYSTSELTSALGLTLEFFGGQFEPETGRALPSVYSPSRITMRSRAVMKLLPYDGFYPVLRTTQMGSIFADDYLSPGFEIPGEHNNKETRNLLNLKISSSLAPAIKPLFSPGLLYNSIKSGLSVDYPIFKNEGTGSLQAYGDYGLNQSPPPRMYQTASLSSSFSLSPIDNERDFRKIGTATTTGAPWKRWRTAAGEIIDVTTQASTRYGLAVTGAYYNGTEDYSIPRLKAVDGADAVARVPFEALYNPEILEDEELGFGNMYDNEPHPSASYCLSGYNHWKIMEYPYKFNSLNEEQILEKWDKEGISKQASDFNSYRLAMNNFLAETADIFLKDSKISCLKSRSNKQWQLAAGNKYAMRLYLENRSTTMYDRFSAFGPPVDSTENYFSTSRKTITKPASYEQVAITGSAASLHTHLVLAAFTDDSDSSSNPDVTTEKAKNYNLTDYQVILKIADKTYTYSFAADDDASHYNQSVTTSAGSSQIIYKDLSSNSSAGTMNTANSTTSRTIGYKTSNSGGISETTLNQVFRDLEFKMGQAIATKSSWFTGPVGSTVDFADSSRIRVPIATDSHEFLTVNTQAKAVAIYIKQASGSTTYTDTNHLIYSSVDNTHKFRIYVSGASYNNFDLDYELVTGISSFTVTSGASGWTANQSSAVIFPTAEGTNISSSGSGQYAFFKYTTNSSGVPTFTLMDGGYNYAVGDTVTIQDQGGSGASAVLTVTTIGGEYTSFQLGTRSNSTSDSNDTPVSLGSVVRSKARGPSFRRLLVGFEDLYSTTTPGRLSTKHFFDRAAALINADVRINQDLTASVLSVGKDFETGNLEVSHTRDRILYIRKKKKGAIGGTVHDNVSRFVGFSGQSTSGPYSMSVDGQSFQANQTNVAVTQNSSGLSADGGIVHDDGFASGTGLRIKISTNSSGQPTITEVTDGGKNWAIGSFFTIADPGSTNNTATFKVGAVHGTDNKLLVFNESENNGEKRGFLHKILGPVEEENRTSETRLTMTGGAFSSTERVLKDNQAGFAFDPYVPPFLDPRRRKKAVPYIDIVVDYETNQDQLLNAGPKLNDPDMIRSHMTITSYNGYARRKSKTGTARSNAMSLTASINPFVDIPLLEGPFDPNRENIEKVWVIAPKWETPIMNFSTVPQTVQRIIKTQDGVNDHKAGLYKIQNEVVNESVYNGGNPDKLYLTSSRGMWHQYSSDPSFYRLIAEAHPNENYKNLAKILFGPPAEGTSRTQVRLGESKGTAGDKKEVAEAVVVMPFRKTRDGYEPIPFKYLKSGSISRDITSREFLNVMDSFITREQNRPPEYNKEKINNFTLDPGIQTQIELMSDFVIPPQYDFLRFPDEVSSTCAMFIMPFYHEMDNEDITNWWQNLPPKIAKNPEYQESFATHSFYPSGETSLEGFVKDDPGKKIIAMNLYDGDPLDINGEIAKIKWKVFKVKKRAKYSYREKLLSSYYGEDYGTSRTFELLKAAQIDNEAIEGYTEQLLVDNKRISWNWPYDFFSLVELVNVESKFDFVIPTEDRGSMTLGTAKQFALTGKFVNVIKKIYNNRY